MAQRSKITISKLPPVPEDGVGRSVSASDDSRPRNLPPSRLIQEGFSLFVDGKAKSLYATAAAASEAGLALKRAFPMLQVEVYDAAAKVRTRIELASAADTTGSQDR